MCLLQEKIDITDRMVQHFAPTDIIITNGFFFFSDDLFLVGLVRVVKAAISLVAANAARCVGSRRVVPDRHAQTASDDLGAQTFFHVELWTLAGVVANAAFTHEPGLCWKFATTLAAAAAVYAPVCPSHHLRFVHPDGFPIRQPCEPVTAAPSNLIGF
jgi:hypothetical protein